MAVLPLFASATAPVAQTMEERVAVWLRGAILSGRFSPGEKLAPPAIAAELDVSITPVREAMRNLAAEGVLRLSPRRGITVRALSPAEAAELRMLHALFARVCGALIAERITGAELATAQRMQADMAAVTDRHDYFALNSAFHLFLHDAARSPELAAMLRRIHDAALPYLPAVFTRTEPRFREGLEEHRRLLDACAARNGQAAGEELMRHYDAMFAEIEAIVA
jgi:DNA-binding GntR family transcriptional regulator